MPRLIRVAWAGPCSLVGVSLGLVVMVLGGRVQRQGPSLEFALSSTHGALPGWARRLRFAAITFGHVIVGQSFEALDQLRAHERVHVRQYERLGPFFFVAYPACSLLAWLRGGCPYADNPFERQAQAGSNTVASSGAALTRRSEPGSPGAPTT